MNDRYLTTFKVAYIIFLERPSILLSLLARKLKVLTIAGMGECYDNTLCYVTRAASRYISILFRRLQFSVYAV
jgi:hypothetical protein